MADVKYRIIQETIKNRDESKGFTDEEPEPSKKRVIASFSADESYGQKKQENHIWWSRGYWPETENNGWTSFAYWLEQFDGKDWIHVTYLEPRDPDEELEQQSLALCA